MSDSFYSFTIFTPQNRRHISFRLYAWILWLSLFLFIGISAAVSIGFYYTYQRQYHTQEYIALKSKVETQEAQIQSHLSALESLQDNLLSILEKEEEIRFLLGDYKGLKTRYKRYRKKKNKISLLLKKDYQLILKEPGTPFDSISTQIDFFNHHLSLTQNAYSKLLIRSETYKQRFAATPSIRPVYGPILSKYGMRRHPVTGKRRLHKGIDIAAWPGAPIKSTADGVVEYADWSGTFGYAIVLNHDFGYQTIYAHCSRLLVKKGHYVKKGAVIAQVGSTGISTGPHLHYEVRKWRRAVSPIKYLDLPLHKAIHSIW